MARPSLPTLTWSTTSVTSIPACTVEDFLDAVRTLLGTTTYWEDTDGGTPTDPATNAFAYLKIGAKAATAVPNQRVMLVFEGTDNMDTTSMAYYNEAGTQFGSPNFNVPVFNYQPEGGEVGFVAVNQFEPYDTKRSLGYWQCGPSTTIFDGGHLINVWIIESDEIFVLCIEDDTNNREYGFMCGPMWIGASDAAGDVDSDAAVADRIWGIQTWPRTWDEKFWGEANNAQDQGAGSKIQSSDIQDNRMACFDPADDTTGLDLGRPRMQFTNDTSTTMVPIEQLTANSGAFVGYDVNFVAYKGLNKSLAQYRYLGTLRQIRAGRGFPSRVVIDSGGSDVAIVRGGSPTLNWDALWFTNS